MPSLLYVSDVRPGSGGGGGIIAQRHLQFLVDKGWRIATVPPGGNLSAEDWLAHTIPKRRPWWPPYRPAYPSIMALRDWFTVRALEAEGISGKRFDVVLTICGGKSSWFAAAIAERWKRPLVAIVHDLWTEHGSADDARVGERVCRLATRILVVSEEMKVALGRFGAAKISVLPPVPCSRLLPFGTWQRSYSAPTVAHVGALHNYHLPYLTLIARFLELHTGRLLVLCPVSNPVLARLKSDIPNLDHVDYFASNEDALRCMAARATALTVMYPLGEAAPGVPLTGFPSRFVEFSQLGLPILLSAPPGNPVRTWAKRHKWLAQFDPGDQLAAASTVADLAEEPSWSKLAAQTRAVAEGEFDPSLIQAQFLEAVTP